MCLYRADSKQKPLICQYCRCKCSSKSNMVSSEAVRGLMLVQKLWQSKDFFDKKWVGNFSNPLKINNFLFVKINVC